MTVACLMGTYGRFSFAREALTCFLQQSVTDATLLIYNQHPVPMSFDHPRVRVVNEVIPNLGLRQIKTRMLELADPSAEFIHFWDDDDLILPWHLRMGLDNIGDSLAWKPHRSWTWHETFVDLTSNYFEGTCLFRADLLRAAPLDTHARYGDHPAYMQLYDSGLIATTELGELSSYIYRWATGIPHTSHYVEGDSDQHAANLDRMRAGLLDTGNGGPLTVADLWPFWRKFLDVAQPLISAEGRDEIEARLGFADAMLALDMDNQAGAGGGT